MQRFNSALPPLCKQLAQPRAVRSCSFLPVATLPASRSHSTRRSLTTSRHVSPFSSARSTRSSTSQQPRRSFATTADKHSTTDANGETVLKLPRSFVVNTATIPGYEIDHVIGLVSGNTVRVRNIVLDYVAGFRAIFGGELSTYTDLMMEARQQATQRMVDEAVELGANAIVNVRVETSVLASNATEMYCYGTAVVVRLTESGSRHDRQPNDGRIQPSLNE